MRKFLLLFGLVIVLYSNATAQNELAIGQWRSHLPHILGQWVTQSEDKVYYATEWSVVSFDKEEFSTDFLSTVNGLSNTGVGIIKYVPGSDILIIVYTNSVIDLVKPREIFTLNQIRNFQGIVGEKTIYDIAIENDSIVYLAANYGVSKLNIRSNRFTFTTFTGVETRSVRTFGGNLYIATEEGVYFTPTDNPNITDISTWQWLGQDEGLPPVYETVALEIYQNYLYFNVNDTLFRWQNDQPERVHTETNFDLQYLSAEGEHLLAGYRCRSGCAQSKVLYFNSANTFGMLAANCVSSPNYAVQDERGRVWFGDRFRDFRMINNVTDGSCNLMTLNSPYSEFSRDMAIYNNQLWMTSGGVDQTFSYRFLDHGFASFIDGRWTIYNRFTRNEIKGENPNNPDDDLFDFLTIAVHPANGTVYAGSFFEGLIEFDGENMTLYNEKNSSLNNAVGDPQRTRISGLAFDEDNNLWVANHTAERPISVQKNNGEWQSFRPGCNVTEIHEMAIDQSGFKWFVTSSSSSGLLVFDEGDLDNPADDRCRVFTSNNSNMPTNIANCLAVDLDGDVWVGTAQGVIIFECGSSVFDEQCQGTLRVVELDGFGAFLLSTQEIQAIAIDGANRKWIGTKNGVFLLSPTGEEQLAHFTTGNSPLFDNNITAIAINQATGEVFIGTDKGIISYQSDATQGGRVNSSNVEVYPNPVRPEYTGPIAIKGLARDANVKITDISGRLIYETQAQGGQAIWDGMDYNGRRAASGVYLVFSTTNARLTGFGDPDAVVAKIVIIN